MESGDDWRTNFSFTMVERDGRDDGDGGRPKIHKGFNARSEVILKELGTKIKDFLGEEVKPGVIVLCGHSLGAAIAQLVYIKLRQILDFDCKLVNITFATPMIGNIQLREELMSDGVGANMYHIVLAGDIVPAALFTEHLYHRLPKFLANWILRWKLRGNLCGEDGEHKGGCQMAVSS